MRLSTISFKGLAFTVLVFIVLSFPIISGFYKYYYTKNYDYLVEAKCDPKIEVCFTRDCSNPDDCPPNGLSVYKEFYVKAFDFPKCKDNSCKDECEKGLIKCTPILCGESSEDACTTAQK